MISKNEDTFLEHYLHAEEKSMRCTPLGLRYIAFMRAVGILEDDSWKEYMPSLFSKTCIKKINDEITSQTCAELEAQLMSVKSTVPTWSTSLRIPEASIVSDNGKVASFSLEFVAPGMHLLTHKFIQDDGEYIVNITEVFSSKAP